MDPLYGLIIDSVLALLLIAVIVVCNIVYKRLKTIREGQEELKELMDSLNRSVAIAQKSVADVRSGSEEVEARIGKQVKSAQKLVDELTLINEAGNNLADRIERGITSADGPVGKRGGDNKKVAEQKDILAALKEAR